MSILKHKVKDSIEEFQVVKGVTGFKGITGFKSQRLLAGVVVSSLIYSSLSEAVTDMYMNISNSYEGIIE